MKSEILRYFTTEVIIIYIFWPFIYWRINALSYYIVRNCFTNYKWGCAEKHYDIEPKEQDIFFISWTTLEYITYTGFKLCKFWGFI